MVMYNMVVDVVVDMIVDNMVAYYHNGRRVMSRFIDQMKIWGVSCGCFFGCFECLKKT